MGIDWTTLTALILTTSSVERGGNALMLGRQQFHMPTGENLKILKSWGIEPPESSVACMEYAEEFLRVLGFSNVDSLDASSFEGASIIQDMNLPLEGKLKDRKFDYIFDGGTTEHIFNVAQTYQNILDMIKLEGVFCSVVPNNNFSGHGFYQFSPEFFHRIFSKQNGFYTKVLLAPRGECDIKKWKLVATPADMQCMFGELPTNVVCVALKKEEKNVRLSDAFPVQVKYETEWKVSTSGVDCCSVHSTVPCKEVA